MLKEKIVLTNSIDESEKLKSLASFNESNFNLRFMSSFELAEYMLQLSGIIYPQKFVSNDELAAKIYKAIKTISYFNLFTYNDVLSLVETINDLRLYIVEDEEETFFSKLPMDKFVNKNSAVKMAYSKIKEILKEEYLIDEIGVIRLALSSHIAQPEIEFIRFEKSNLKPLQIALLNKAAGKEILETKINVDKKPLKIKRYTKSFGQTNEIEDILNYIYQEQIPFDQCLIASAEESNYANTLINYRDLLNCPITIGVGKLITSTGPGRLFSLIDDWQINHYRYEYLLKIIESEFFDVEKFKKDIYLPDDLTELNQDLDYLNQISLSSIIEIVGRLKCNFDVSENRRKVNNYEELVNRYDNEKYNEENTKSRIKSLTYVWNVIEILNRGMANFINRYALIINKKDDITALNKILRLLEFEDKYGIEHEEIRLQIYGQKSSREKPQPGSLYFTSISRAASCLRKHLFIVGLSSNNFPGTSKENPILLDRDYLCFGVKNASSREIENNKNNYFSLLDEATKYGANIYLSWSSYNSQTLKNQNSSSVILETYCLENGKQKTLSDFDNEFKNNKSKYRYVEYFNNDLLPIAPVGRLINENKQNKCDIEKQEEEKKPIAVSTLKNKKISATMLTDFAKCQYLFYIKYVLNIKQPEDIDVFEVIPANELGTIAHELLEHLDKSKTSLHAFKEIAGDRFDEYLLFNYCDNPVLIKKCKEDFLDMMSTAYSLEEGKQAAFREKDIYYTDPNSGITIHGFPDKVIENTDGTYRVIDYKTGKTVKHYRNDIPSMIQCTLYSYILEKTKNVKVTSFEYRYIWKNSSVDSGPMDKHYEDLKQTLMNLKKAIETGEFIENDKVTTCNKCYFKDVCLKRKKSKE